VAVRESVQALANFSEVIALLAESSTCVAAAPNAGPETFDRDSMNTCPFEFTATAPISPRFISGGYLK
jgi:hypothetical protein